MLKTTVDLSAYLPIGRGKAAEIAGVAGRFQSMATLENNGIVLNAKSMIGLLSQSVSKDGKMVLVVSGVDEEAAMEAILDVLKG